MGSRAVAVGGEAAVMVAGEAAVGGSCRRMVDLELVVQMQVH